MGCNNKEMTRTADNASAVALGASRKKVEFASLDFMRGLSAFAVLVSHVDSLIAGGESLLRIPLGSMAVQVFMLISGFLMMWHFLDRRERGDLWGNKETYQKFYIRRFFRIAPLYYFLLTLVYFFAADLTCLKTEIRAEFAPTYVANTHNPTVGGISIAHILAHYSFIFGFIPKYAQSTHLPDWSIGLEMQFYLFFPLIALMLIRSHYICGTIVLLGLNWFAAQLFGVGLTSEPKMFGLFPYPTFLPLMIDRFLIGILIAAAFFERMPNRKQIYLLILALIVAGLSMKKLLLITGCFVLYEFILQNGSKVRLIDCLTARVDRIFKTPFVKFLADTSYGIYLVHLPVLFCLIPLLIRYTGFEDLSKVSRLFVLLGVSCPILYGISYLLFRYIEVPGIAWGRRIVMKLGQP